MRGRGLEKMIQALKVPKNAWHLYWLDLEEPLPTGRDWFVPTLVVVCDREGTPVAPPEIMEELDQERVETMLYRIFDKTPPPDQLMVPQDEEWAEEDWRSFSAECKVDIRFQPAERHAPEELRAMTRAFVMHIGRPEKSLPSPEEIAHGLVRTGLRLRSQHKRALHFKLALSKDPECAPAHIELADAEFAAGNWKACGEAYGEVIRRGAALRADPHTVWWLDPATRPYLRAIYGKAMTAWHLSRFTEAAADLEDLLKCNPTDNQGTRFLIPMLHLLAENPEAAAKYFRRYEKNYPEDFKEPSFLFGWAINCSLEGRETAARAKYTEGILRNIHIAPMLLEVEEPPRQLWIPNDRADANYASEFVQSYAVLWDREPGALRILREVWQEIQPRIREIVIQRERIQDFQDQHYDPHYKTKWQALLDDEEKLCTP
jgi:tetratricopeptide (TPR) repeat protein